MHRCTYSIFAPFFLRIIRFPSAGRENMFVSFIPTSQAHFASMRLQEKLLRNYIYVCYFPNWWSKMFKMFPKSWLMYTVRRPSSQDRGQHFPNDYVWWITCSFLPFWWYFHVFWSGFIVCFFRTLVRGCLHDSWLSFISEWNGGQLVFTWKMCPWDRNLKWHAITTFQSGMKFQFGFRNENRNELIPEWVTSHSGIM